MDETNLPSTLSRQIPNRPLILVVGDNTDTRELYALVLANHGFSVIETGEGEQTLDLAMSAAPDAIVIDLMAKVSGLDVIKRLRGNATTFRTPILIMTADTSAGDEESVAADEENVRTSAYAECAKPCMPGDFVNQLNAILVAGPA